MSGASSVWW